MLDKWKHLCGVLRRYCCVRSLRSADDNALARAEPGANLSTDAIAYPGTVARSDSNGRADLSKRML
jgi:hypothetical protein